MARRTARLRDKLRGKAHRTINRLLLLVLAGAAGLLIWSQVERHPQDWPWTELTLNQPIGRSTALKLAGLREDFPRCRALLDAAGVDYVALEPQGDGDCRRTQSMRPQDGVLGGARFSPAAVSPSCPVLAALYMWERQVVQPAAVRLFGQRVATIEHFGSYSCRRLYGRDEGPFSQHATANAIDIAAFRLADGRRISVVNGWSEAGEDDAEFLRAVRDGACDLFATTLSPDYNRAHRDHFHLDQADRGGFGWTVCR